MKFSDSFSLFLLLRRAERIGRTLDARLAEQNVYLKRIADHLAPDLKGEPVDQATRSVDFSEDLTQARILDYIDRTIRDVGREPTEDEILAFLDGKPA